MWCDMLIYFPTLKFVPFLTTKTDGEQKAQDHKLTTADAF